MSREHGRESHVTVVNTISGSTKVLVAAGVTSCGAL